jgi:hypothetical protein
MLNQLDIKKPDKMGKEMAFGGETGLIVLGSCR